MDHTNGKATVLRHVALPSLHAHNLHQDARNPRAKTAQNTPQTLIDIRLEGFCRSIGNVAVAVRLALVLADSLSSGPVWRFAVACTRQRSLGSTAVVPGQA
jgi:hypothetical protein